MIALTVALLLPLVWLTGVQGPHLMAARDRALRLAAVAGGCALVPTALHLAIAWALVLWRWRTPAGLGRVLTWAGIIAAWYVGQSLGPWAGVLETAWPALGALQAVAVTAHWLAARGGGLTRTDPVSAWPHAGGTFGHRTMAAGYLALVLPLAVASPGAWLLTPLLLLGLGVTCSWAALIAATAGLLVAGPPVVSATAAGILATGGLVILLGWVTGARWAAHTTRGDTLDTWRTRWGWWRTLWAIWRRWPIWLVGRGLGTTRRDLAYAPMLWATVLPSRGVTGHAHNELVEWCYETGVAGIVALVALAWQVAPGLALGDPWSGVVVAGAVLMLGTYAAHVVPVGGAWWLAAAMVAAR